MTEKCTDCGNLLENEAADGGVCGRCAKLARMRGTWRRQMWFYAGMMLAGAVLIALAQSLYGHAEGGERAHFLMAALGGFGVLGGLFGLGLAVFFHLWHR